METLISVFLAGFAAMMWYRSMRCWPRHKSGESCLAGFVGTVCLLMIAYFLGFWSLVPWLCVLAVVETIGFLKLKKHKKHRSIRRHYKDWLVAFNFLFALLLTILLCLSFL